MPMRWDWLIPARASFIVLATLHHTAEANFRAFDRTAAQVAFGAMHLDRLSDDLAPEDLPFEFFMNALRLREGVPSHLFAERTGLTLSQIEATLGRASKRGMLSQTAERLAPTAQGWLFLNDLVAQFLPE